MHQKNCKQQLPKQSFVAIRAKPIQTIHLKFWKLTFGCVQSRSQRPRSFWLATGIATSGQVQLRKSAIHGLPVNVRMLRVKSNKSDWFWSQSIVFTQPFKLGVPLFPAHDKKDPWGRGLGVLFLEIWPYVMIYSKVSPLIQKCSFHIHVGYLIHGFLKEYENSFVAVAIPKTFFYTGHHHASSMS